MHGKGIRISSLLMMITLVLDMYRGNPMPWIHSLNLRWDQITHWVNISSTSIGSKWCVKLDSFHEEHEIISQLFALGSPLQNGEVERR